MLRELTSLQGTPFRGGAITAVKKGSIPFGGFSWVQNVRNTRPGLEKRPGQRKLHSTADGSNRVENLYEFMKTRTSENQFFAQMSDGDLLVATSLPPTVTTGVFGNEAHDGSASQIPASFATILDMMLYSNGVDQHQIYGGTGSYVEDFIVFAGSAAPPAVPTEGRDYSSQVSDGRATTAAILDSLPTLVNHGCVFIGTPVPAESLLLTILASNGNAAAATIAYWNGAWTGASGVSDATASGGASLAQTGTISWTKPSDEISKYQYGKCKFWYRLSFSAALDAEVEVSSVTFGAGFQDIRNLWDGVPQYGVEVQVEQGDTNYATFGASAVDLTALPAGRKLYIACTDPVEALYWDVGETPCAQGVDITSVKYWSGHGFESVGTVDDGTDGLTHSGWWSFGRQSSVMPRQFGSSQYQAYWYEIIFDAALSVDFEPALLYMPYFDVDELGNGRCCAAWKDRAVYTFDLWGAYLYVSKTNRPLVLNGSDFGILKAGDGRSNQIVGARKFHNELMVWQEEKGVEGGCVTLFEGYSPETFGKLVLSSQIGAVNNKSIDVVDGVTVATRTDEAVKTVAFWVSRYGICATDGRSVQVISDDIQNYFDSSKPECIRRGYEQRHWLKYDSAYGVLRIGLASGAAATEANVFPVYDLSDRTWSFDTPKQELSCVTEVTGATGQAAVLQVAGGIDDGTVYQINYGKNDVTTAIDAYADMQLGYKGQLVQLAELILRCEARTNGTLTLVIYDNDEEVFAVPLSMISELGSNATCRHRLGCNVESQQPSIRIRNGEKDAGFTLIDIGLRSFTNEGV